MLTVEECLHTMTRAAREHSFRVREVEGLFDRVRSHQIVGFRGTELSRFVTGHGWRDVLRDVRFLPWYDKRVGFAHAGFLRGARGAVDKGLFGFLRRDEPVVLVGHSLGGAIAVIAALMLHSMKFNVVQVVTVGAPKALSAWAVKRFLKTGIYIIQYANPGDPVPDLPPHFLPYRHVHEVKTLRKAKGYSALANHSLEDYEEALFEDVL